MTTLPIISKPNTTIELSTDDLEKCRNFSSRLDDNYAQRGQSNLLLKRKQAYGGKCAEVATALYLKQTYGLSFQPDFTIYEAEQKNFDADLTSSNSDIKFAVKSSDNSTNYKGSWIFQHATNKSGGSAARDRLIFDTHPSQLKNTFCVFTEGSGDWKNVTVSYIVRADALRITNAFTRTILPSMQNEKKAVYATNAFPFVRVSLDSLLEQAQQLGDDFDSYLCNTLAKEEAAFQEMQDRVNKLAGTIRGMTQ